jgi:DNA-binding PadR family transcriptional regulator
MTLTFSTRWTEAFWSVDPDGPAPAWTVIVQRCTISSVNDSALALLGLLGELRSASGYAVSAVVRERGMRRWAGLSASSVYNGLRQLEAEKLAKSTPDRHKRGKGPIGRLYRLTARGTKTVRTLVADGLAQAPEQSTQFRLSLAFVDLVGVPIALTGLRERSRAFRTRSREVAGARPPEAGRASLGATLLFEYVESSLEHERAATERLIRALEKRR